LKRSAIAGIVVIIVLIVLLIYPYPIEEKIEEQIPEESTQKERPPENEIPSEPSIEEESIKDLIENPLITTEEATPSCSGSERCISGTVTRVIDGDTVEVNGQSIRFALSSTPEMNNDKGILAKAFVENLCPTGSQALVDEDDKQTQGSYGRIIGIVYCNGINLNEAVLDAGYGWLSSGFCSRSEFSTHAWAQKYGCGTPIQEVKPPQVTTEQIKTSQSNCDPSYPDVCIDPYPPDLDCAEIPYQDFRVLPPDRHGFDIDNDGIGCES